MARFSLILAFVMSAVGFLIPKLNEILDIELPGAFYLIFHLPAVILGMGSWCKVRCFAHSWPVVACVLAASLGLLYGAETKSWQGVMIAVSLAAVLPIAALIVEHRCWWLCAKTYVVTNAFVLAAVLWFAYHEEHRGLSLFRLGWLRSDDGMVVLRYPNHLGSQLAVAAVLAFILYLHAGTKGNQVQSTSNRRGAFSLGWTVFLSLGCILTASRGAFVACFGGMGMLFFWGTRALPSSKLKDLLVVLWLAILVALCLSVAGVPIPGGSLQERFAGPDGSNLATLGNRTTIWKSAYNAWRSDMKYTIRGVGTGRASEIVGRFHEFAKGDGYGIHRKSCHNTCVEWLVSLGLLGAVPAICLLGIACSRARELDARDGTVNRQAILISVLLASMVGIIYSRFDWIGVAPLMLAMLSQPAAVRRLSRLPLVSGELRNCSEGQQPRESFCSS